MTKQNTLLHQTEFVRPIDPSQEDKRAHVRVLAHLEIHGRNTLAQIANATSINKNTVRTSLFRLANEGKVCKTPIGEKGYFQCWQIGTDKSYAERSASQKNGVIQRVVKKWEPCTLRDPMIDLLFGRAK